MTTNEIFEASLAAVRGESEKPDVDLLLAALSRSAGKTQAAESADPASLAAGPQLDRILRALVGLSDSGNGLRGAAPSPSAGAGNLLSAAATQARNYGAGAALGAIPLIGGILRLFRRMPEAVEPDLIQYAPPPPVQIDLGLSGNGQTASEVSYGELALPRPVPASTGTRSPQQVYVQVQALDSRSFLDHSDDIARAVREAMLSSHSLNDIVGDL